MAIGLGLGSISQSNSSDLSFHKRKVELNTQAVWAIVIPIFRKKYGHIVRVRVSNELSSHIGVSYISPPTKHFFPSRIRKLSFSVKVDRF